MAAKKGPRQVVFVCSAVKNGVLVSSVISSESLDDARDLFKALNEVNAESVTGPFYKKKMGILDAQIQLRFTEKTVSGLYNNWYVRGFELEKPNDCSYVLFVDQKAGKKMPRPAPTIVKTAEITLQALDLSTVITPESINKKIYNELKENKENE